MGAIYTAEQSLFERWQKEFKINNDDGFCCDGLILNNDNQYEFGNECLILEKVDTTRTQTK